MEGVWTRPPRLFPCPLAVAQLGIKYGDLHKLGPRTFVLQTCPDVVDPAQGPHCMAIGAWVGVQVGQKQIMRSMPANCIYEKCGEHIPAPVTKCQQQLNCLQAL